jgi:hypothetical protein
MPSEDESSDVVAPAIPSSDVALIKALLSDDDDTVEAGDVRRQFACITAIDCSRVRCVLRQKLLVTRSFLYAQMAYRHGTTGLATHRNAPCNNSKASCLNLSFD